MNKSVVAGVIVGLLILIFILLTLVLGSVKSFVVTEAYAIGMQQYPNGS